MDPSDTASELDASDTQSLTPATTPESPSPPEKGRPIISPIPTPYTSPIVEHLDEPDRARPSSKRRVIAQRIRDRIDALLQHWRRPRRRLLKKTAAVGLQQGRR